MDKRGAALLILAGCGAQTDQRQLDVATLAVGQPGEVRVDALPGSRFAGEVTEIALQGADYRGDGRVSAYQIMSMVAMVYALSIGFWLTDIPAHPASIALGLQSLWDPGTLLFLQLLWIVSFVYMGRSSVTEARMEIHLCNDKI